MIWLQIYFDITYLSRRTWEYTYILHHLFMVQGGISLMKNTNI